MNSLRKSILGSGLMLGLILSIAPVHQAKAAEVEVAEWNFKNTTMAITGLTLALATGPLISNYYMRKPLTEERTNWNLLLKACRNGTWTECKTHSWYFFLDKVIGWPYKDGRQKFKIKGNEVKSHIEPAQYPGGILGNFHAYVLIGYSKALEFPLVSGAILAGMLYLVKDKYMNFDFMPKKERDDQQSKALIGILEQLKIMNLNK